MEPVIQTSGLSIGYAGKALHERLDLELFPGKVTCLLGLNGAGKSTLLRTLCGFQVPLKGRIYLQGKPLGKYSPSSLSLTIGVVLTEKTHAGDLTAYDLVSLGRHPHTGFFGALKKLDREVIEQSLEAVGMASKASRHVAEMSDGERQKVMIAKALAQECPVIILDEPTAFLDVTSRIETMVLLRKLAKEQQKTILLSTHDMEQAIQMGDSFWLLRRDYPVVCGTPEDLILNGEIATFFEKDNVTFDPFVGKLSVNSPISPIGVEGDPLTAYWVGNALVRNQWKPSLPSPDYTGILCISKNELLITSPGGIQQQASSIAGLLELLSGYQGKRK
ncbi:iron(III) ABC transporter ATP-binding protein [Bacteroidia bacterium]|nr:iron(III) ABC transporter ATP-binding protein [Bacteroidia bacterium]